MTMDPKILERVTDQGRGDRERLQEEEPGLTESERQLLLRLANRLAPRRLVWGVFPGGGVMEPMPAGDSVFDLGRRVVETPKGQLSLGIGPDVARGVQSLTINPDSTIEIDLQPGANSAATMASGVLTITARDVRTMTIRASAPYNLQVVFNTGLDSLISAINAITQERFSDTTLTKIDAAASQDSLQNLLFVPRFGPNVLTQATFGADFIINGEFGQKMYVVRNVGSNDAEVQLFGTVYARVAAVHGWVADTDTGGARTTISAGDQAILETNLPWGLTQLRAAVAQAEASGAQTRLVVEYKGMPRVAR